MCVIRELLNNREKVREFQRKNGLDADGLVGYRTLAAMRDLYALEWAAYQAAVRSGAFEGERSAAEFVTP